ncbi:MAG TPA: AI-2E family transporter [Synergistaceae bacterium]|nr:AI-2E family transporter [Synergistaceae bacterium]
MKAERIILFFTGIITIILLGTVLKMARGVFIPLVIAGLLYFLFAPVVKFMSDRKIPTPVSTAVVLLIFIGICVAGGLFINTRIQAMIGAFPRYYARFETLFDALIKQFELSPVWWENFHLAPVIGERLLALSGFLMGFLTNLILVVFFLIFLLLDAPYFDNKIDMALSPSNAARARSVTRTISKQISAYLFLQFIISAATGLLAWGLFAVAQLDFAITWGVLTFLLNFIPNLGSFIAAFPPILISLIQYYPELGPTIFVTVGLLIIQQTIGNFLAPKVMGERLNLSPVVILVSLLMWGSLWGVMGAILSVPITCSVKIIFDNIEPLKPLGVLMSSGKFAHRARAEKNKNHS